MAEIIVLPQQGNSVESCIIQSWHISEGDTIAVDQTICEVETDKATLEVPATAAGTVLKLFAAEGDEVPVMSPLVAVGETGEVYTEGPKTPEPVSASATAVPETDAATRPTATADGKPTDDSTGKDERRPHRASPRARLLAVKLGIGVDGLTGSGPGGRVIVRDVEAASSEGSRSASIAPGAPQVSAQLQVSTESTAFEDIPVSGIRAVIADRMLASLQSSAQLTLHSSADARRLLAYRERVKAQRTASPGEGSDAVANVTINDMVNLAVSRVLPGYPELNAHFLGTSIRRFTGVDLGFAVDTEKGLLVPTITRVDRRSLTSIHEEARALAERALSGKATPVDLAPATFTVTNLGSFGVEYFTPVLNVPQVAILGIGAITDRPAPRGSADAGSFIPQIALSLTIDHRAVDGAPAARFLQALCTAIADFDLLLAR